MDPIGKLYGNMPEYYCKKIIKYRYLRVDWLERDIMKKLGISTRGQCRLLLDNVIYYFEKGIRQWELDN